MSQEIPVKIPQRVLEEIPEWMPVKSLKWSCSNLYPEEIPQGTRGEILDGITGGIPGDAFGRILEKNSRRISEGTSKEILEITLGETSNRTFSGIFEETEVYLWNNHWRTFLMADEIPGRIFENIMQDFLN